MDFRTALKTVYEMRNSDAELCGSFLVYSLMADLIGNSYADKKKLSLFFAVDKRLNLFKLITEKSIYKIEKIRRKQYCAVADLLSEKAFNRLIDVLLEVVGAEIVAGGVKRRKKIEMKSDGLGIFKAALLFASASALIICGILHVRWNIYRWIIGVAVSIMLIICGNSVSVFVNKRVFDCIVFGTLSVINFILYCVLKEKYNVVCYWISAAILLSNLCSSVKSFNDDEPVFGWVCVGEYYLTVSVILLNIFL